jgi:hypothetical protein
MRLAAFLQVALMIFFSAPERWGGFDLRHDWTIEPAALLQFFFRSVRGDLLLRRMIKNYRSILHANIGALPVRRRGIMVRPENLQKFVIADLRRIELHFHDLGVSGLVGAHILIRRILLCSPRIPDAGGQNTFYVSECFLHSPETTRTERSFLRLHANTMKRLHHVRNQMLAGIRDLTCMRRSPFHGT